MKTELEKIQELIASDALAITCQSLGQYRAILLREIDKLIKESVSKKIAEVENIN